MNNKEQFRKNVEIIAKNFKKLKNLGFDIENLNLGGGFPEAVVVTLHLQQQPAKCGRHDLYHPVVTGPADSRQYCPIFSISNSRPGQSCGAGLCLQKFRAGLRGCAAILPG